MYQRLAAAALTLFSWGTTQALANSPGDSPLMHSFHAPGERFDPAKEPYCGGPFQVFCARSRPCGSAETIDCPPQPGSPSSPAKTAERCGSFAQPACRVGLPCGAHDTLTCATQLLENANRPPPKPQPELGVQVTPFSGFSPPGFGNGAALVATPEEARGTAQPGDFKTGETGEPSRLVPVPIPDLNALTTCRSTFLNDDGNFLDCVVSTSLPAPYKLLKHCIRENENDPVAESVCSFGSIDDVRNYKEIRRLQRCYDEREGRKNDQGRDISLSACFIYGNVGKNKQYYATCLQQNSGDFTKAMICGLAKDLRA